MPLDNTLVMVRTYKRLQMGDNTMHEHKFRDSHYPQAEQYGVPELVALRLVNQWNATSPAASRSIYTV